MLSAALHCSTGWRLSDVQHDAAMPHLLVPAVIARSSYASDNVVVSDYVVVETSCSSSVPPGACTHLVTSIALASLTTAAVASGWQPHEPLKTAAGAKCAERMLLQLAPVLLLFAAWYLTPALVAATWLSSPISSLKLVCLKVVAAGSILDSLASDSSAC